MRKSAIFLFFVTFCLTILGLSAQGGIAVPPQTARTKVKTEEKLGEMKVLKAFSMSGQKQVLGGKHISGQLSVGDSVKIDRRGIDLGYGKILNLQVARADVKEIHVEGEFGLQVEAKSEIAGGDTLTAFRVVEA